MTPDYASNLSTLLARVEGAEGADRYADCWLACAFDDFFPHLEHWIQRDVGATWRVNFCCYRDGGIVSPGQGGDQMVPAYTASLDAALALCERVLPGWNWHMAQGVLIQAGLIHPSGTKFGGGYATHRTRALALLAAMLKALIAQGATAAPEPPWAPGAATNAKRNGWVAFFEGRGREDCPFPIARRDLQDGYREGWDAAAAPGQVEA